MLASVQEPTENSAYDTANEETLDTTTADADSTKVDETIVDEENYDTDPEKTTDLEETQEDEVSTATMNDVSGQKQSIRAYAARIRAGYPSLVQTTINGIKLVRLQSTIDKTADNINISLNVVQSTPLPMVIKMEIKTEPQSNDQNKSRRGRVIKKTKYLYEELEDTPAAPVKRKRLTEGATPVPPPKVKKVLANIVAAFISRNADPLNCIFVSGATQVEEPAPEPVSEAETRTLYTHAMHGSDRLGHPIN